MPVTLCSTAVPLLPLPQTHWTKVPFLTFSVLGEKKLSPITTVFVAAECAGGSPADASTAETARTGTTATTAISFRMGPFRGEFSEDRCLGIRTEHRLER